MVLAHPARPDLLELRPDRAVPAVDREGRDVPGAAPRHLGDALLVEPAAVLDRVDAGADRHQQARPAERVADDRHAGHVGLVDDRLDLLAA